MTKPILYNKISIWFRTWKINYKGGRECFMQLSVSSSLRNWWQCFIHCDLLLAPAPFSATCSHIAAITQNLRCPGMSASWFKVSGTKSISFLNICPKPTLSPEPCLSKGGLWQFVALWVFSMNAPRGQFPCTVVSLGNECSSTTASGFSQYLVLKRFGGKPHLDWCLFWKQMPYCWDNLLDNTGKHKPCPPL